MEKYNDDACFKLIEKLTLITNHIDDESINYDEIIDIIENIDNVSNEIIVDLEDALTNFDSIINTQGSGTILLKAILNSKFNSNKLLNYFIDNDNNGNVNWVFDQINNESKFIPILELMKINEAWSAELMTKMLE